MGLRLSERASARVSACGVGPAVVAQGLQFLACRHRLHCAEAPLDSFDEHLAHRLAGEPIAFPSPPDHDLTVAAVLREGGRHSLAQVALDFEAIRAPAKVPARHSQTALMGACGLAPVCTAHALVVQRVRTDALRARPRRRRWPGSPVHDPKRWPLWRWLYGHFCV